MQRKVSGLYLTGAVAFASLLFVGFIVLAVQAEANDASLFNLSGAAYSDAVSQANELENNLNALLLESDTAVRGRVARIYQNSQSALNMTTGRYNNVDGARRFFEKVNDFAFDFLRDGKTRLDEADFKAVQDAARFSARINKRLANAESRFSAAKVRKRQPPAEQFYESGGDIGADLAVQNGCYALSRVGFSDFEYLGEKGSHKVSALFGTDLAQISIARSGAVLDFFVFRNTGAPTIDALDAAKAAADFAGNLFGGEFSVFKIRVMGNKARVSVAPVVDGVVMYPRLARITIALDDGQAISLDARAYHYRENIEFLENLTYQQITKLINGRFDVLNIKKAIVLDAFGDSVCVFEILAEKNAEQFAVLVNALSGRIERVVRRDSQFRTSTHTSFEPKDLRLSVFSALTTIESEPSR